jgi:hypothetical protein
LSKVILERLAKSFDGELIQAARDAETRLDKLGIPVQNGHVWTLHSDLCCQALWSCGHKTEKTLSELHAGNAIGAVQYFCSDEPGAPFDWQ